MLAVDESASWNVRCLYNDKYLPVAEYFLIDSVAVDVTRVRYIL